MTYLFHRPIMVCNAQSGSHDPEMETQLGEILRAAGRPFVHSIHLPDDDVPSRDMLEAHEADLLVIWTGDGSIRAAAQKIDGWDGAILPLPGGTLNLLSKKLHGDRDPADILRDVVSDHAMRRSIPILRGSAHSLADASSGPSSGEGDDSIALITILAGPATRWAEVRETLRQDGIISATRSAPDAVNAMLNAPGVRVTGHAGEHSAVILTPLPNGIDAHGILAEGAMDLLRHGLAWLGGDFRDGPSQFITKAAELCLESDRPISIEFDGELTEHPSPLFVRLGHSATDFLSTR
ncbi:diacylglycerol kinase family protein [Sphingopyxis yananensis]|uniref:diacylglycerol kinase family protein n=1 Tax=Sphingopyxis yananensis TaxID=2886687 RepID=UPI001D126FE4|nr:diacylglycerol kinase family protein [Sphingopyxis yananensis]MCC2601739.1 sphingosine kinase [Sphingopyxis yananensis]